MVTPNQCTATARLWGLFDKGEHYAERPLEGLDHLDAEIGVTALILGISAGVEGQLSLP